MRNHTGLPGAFAEAVGTRTRLRGWRRYSTLRARAFAALRRAADQTLRTALALSLLSTTAPAAPRVLADAAVEWKAGAAVWLLTSPLAARLKRSLGGARAPAAKAQEEQSARDARVSRIRISPDDVNIMVGERVYFAAVAYDPEGAPVGGISFKWGAHHGDQDRPMGMTRDGLFEPRRPGVYRVTAEGAGRKARTVVRVRENPRREGGGNKANPSGGRNVTTRALPGRRASLPAARPGVKRAARVQGEGSPVFRNASFAASEPVKAMPVEPAAAAAPRHLDDYSWDDGNYWAADDPGNTRGDPPGNTADEGAGSGNFQIAVPVLSLDGRGIDLTLGLAYNSRVWNKAQSEFTFDIDRDWPAPGWSLGFGKMIRMGDQGTMLVDADGTRHGFRGQKNGGSFSGHTVDGTFIDYWSMDDGFGGLIGGHARLANGTVIQYGARSQNIAYPTRVTDQNGNFITITYRGFVGPQIDTITDTLNRVVQFHYDANNLLTAVTAPELVSGQRTLVRLHYRQLTLGYNFAGTARVRDGAPWVLDAIFYPATGTGYWFGDSDSYSSYGMITRVSERRGMGLSASSLNEQGTITSAGIMTRQEEYDYPAAPTQTLSDAPTYSNMTQTWEGMDTPAAVTTYTVHDNASPRRLEVKYPDNTKSIQLSYNLSHLADSDPNKARDGYVYHDETRDADGNLLQSSTVDWVTGHYESPRPTRTEAASHEIGKKAVTTYEYGPAFNQVVHVRNYDYCDLSAEPTVLLRRTTTEYENGANYTSMRHIINLPKKVEVFAGDDTRISLTVYQYDAAPLQLTPGVAMHDPAFDPSSEEQCGWEPDRNDPDYLYGPSCQLYDPQSCDGIIPDVWICHPVYDPGTNLRGNVTQVTSYTNAASEPAAGAIVETQTYDITGNMVTEATQCCDQATHSYSAATHYAYATSHTQGSADPDSPLRITTSATYDFNTGVVLSATDPDGRTSQSTYYPTTLRPKEDILPTGGLTLSEYDDYEMKITRTTSLADGGVAAKGVLYMNGTGGVRREEELTAGNAWDAVETKLDKMGRVWKQSRPYRVGEESPQFAEYFYDALGRVWKVKGADQSESTVVYNPPDRPSAAQPGQPPGQTAKSTDAWGRERWQRVDALGRMAEVVEPNPSGGGAVATGGLLTTYSYDALDRLVQSQQGAQQRRFAYDSLGRLVRQKLAEATAVFNDEGQYVGPGGQGAAWSDLFAYDARSNLVSRTDARNVRTTYFYADAQGNPDPLNRLLRTTYAVQTGSIPAANPVTFTYDTAGDLTKVRFITTNDAATAATRTTEEYRYDLEGRIAQKTVTLASRPDHALDINYVYDTLDRVTDVVYPKQYPSQTRKTVHHDFDVASRLRGVKVGGADYAAQIEYNAASQPTSLAVGAAGQNRVTEKYTYSPATGLLSEQRAFRGTEQNPVDLLHLSYDYLRPATTAGRTGQVTKITNHINQQRGRSFRYDALGRLVEAKGGDPTASALWTQTYTYDRYGNRETVSATGVTASLDAPGLPGRRAPRVEVASNAAPRLPDLFGAQAVRSHTDGPGGPALFGAAKSAAALFYSGPPSNLTVTSSSSTQVSLSWGAPAGVINHYEVERAQTLAGPYTVVGTPAGTTFTDSGATAGRAYLYRVRAVDAGGRSGPSNAALAATFSFTDDPLAQGVTKAKAQHVSELRAAVNAVRHAAGMGDATFTDPTLQPPTTPIKAVHIQELRDRLNEALAALQISSSPFTDPVLATGPGGTRLKKAHVAELRQRASRGQSQSTGGNGGGPVPTDGHTSLSYDQTSNRVNSPGWQYDAAGNQTRIKVADNVWQRMEYDAANRLSRVTSDDGSTVLASFTYGDDNTRLVAHEGAGRTYYAWGTYGGVAEYVEQDGTAWASSPMWSKNNVYLDGRLLATQEPNGVGGEFVQYHHPDRLGTRVVTNGVDATFFEQAALPFGTALEGESTGSTTRRFTSYERSAATKLDNAINRQYDPQQGRFTQVDPIRMDAASLDDPQSLNMYTYCGNDPVNHLDPDGLFFKKLFRWLAKAFKWIALAVTIAVTVLSILANPAGLFAFKWAATALKWLSAGLAKIGAVLNKIGLGFLTKFAFVPGGGILAAEAGSAAAGLGGLQILGAIGAAVGQNKKKPSGKTKRRQEKEARRAERQRRANTRVRLPPGISTEPKVGKPIVEVPAEPERPPQPKVEPGKPKLPENATRAQKVRFAISRVLAGVGQYIKGSTLMIMVNPAVIAEQACRENPYSPVCLQFQKFLSPEKRCELIPGTCA